jgi:hypothetical protein
VFHTENELTSGVSSRVLVLTASFFTTDILRPSGLSQLLPATINIVNVFHQWGADMARIHGEDNEVSARIPRECKCVNFTKGVTSSRLLIALGLNI